MNALITPAPVRRSVLVDTDPARAFSIFTARMGAWWPKGHSVNQGSKQADVVVEPRPGGRWFERGEDGSECPWGHVIAWDPPGRVLLAWQLDANWTFNPALVTEVEVTFMKEGDGKTRVLLEHQLIERFGELAARTREALDSPHGWQGIIDLYAALVAA
jgi:uncharacterized protein YndB with AHSA1/START domain